MAWTLIASLDTPSSGAFTFTSLTLSSYGVIQIICSGITVTTDGTDVRLTFYVSGSEVVTGYRWGSKSVSSGGTANNDGDTSDPSILLNSNDANWDVGNASTKSLGAIITVDAPASTALHKKAEIEAVMVGPTGNVLINSGVGVMENAGAIDGIKISGSSNLTAGKVRILGLA